MLETWRKFRDKTRLKALQIVSGLENAICIGCGCPDLRVLEIHHKNGHGAKEIRHARKEGVNLYRIQTQNLCHAIVKGRRKTDDLEILCKVCNAKHYVERRFGVRYKVEFLGGPD
jgi:hypothetical protein